MGFERKEDAIGAVRTARFCKAPAIWDITAAFWMRPPPTRLSSAAEARQVFCLCVRFECFAATRSRRNVAGADALVPGGHPVAAEGKSPSHDEVLFFCRFFIHALYTYTPFKSVIS